MILYKKAESLTAYLQGQKEQGKTIGFVPTMGALHQGHLSLIELSKQTCDITVCSIFVNPTQFNDKKDFDKYPVTIPQDILLLEVGKCDVLFLPSVDEMYPLGTENVKTYPLGQMEILLEGKYRPGHFQGVCQVVDRLLHIVQPDQLFLGQKDYQQCMVIKKLIEHLQLPVQLILADTLREPTGLAMSSRNSRLNEVDKAKAAAIYKTLNSIKDNYKSTPINHLQQQAVSNLLSNGFSKVDYVSIANATTLQPITDNDDQTKAVALVAAFIGDVRLIDNMILTP